MQCKSINVFFLCIIAEIDVVLLVFLFGVWWGAYSRVIWGKHHPGFWRKSTCKMRGSIPAPIRYIYSYAICCTAFVQQQFDNTNNVTAISSCFKLVCILFLNCSKSTLINFISSKEKKDSIFYNYIQVYSVL